MKIHFAQAIPNLFKTNPPPSFSLSPLILHRHSHSHTQRRCLGHTSLSMHGDRRVYSVPRFQPAIDPFIGHPSHNGKMPVYRAPCICSQIHRDTAIKMAQGRRTQTRHANATHPTPTAARTREHQRAKSSAPAARCGPPSSHPAEGSQNLQAAGLQPEKTQRTTANRRHTTLRAPPPPHTNRC